MKASLLNILQHSLGLDEYGRGTPYRNHFVTGEGSKITLTAWRLSMLGTWGFVKPSSRRRG